MKVHPRSEVRMVTVSLAELPDFSLAGLLLGEEKTLLPSNGVVR